MAELVLRQPCEHGESGRHVQFPLDNLVCPGGSEIVLDPDKVLVLARHLVAEHPIAYTVTVADVLAALEETQ